MMLGELDPCPKCGKTDRDETWVVHVGGTRWREPDGRVDVDWYLGDGDEFYPKYCLESECVHCGHVFIRAGEEQEPA